jgi:hypothetical protein
VPESPAALLRRAAEKMRGLANTATEGPWWFDEDEHCWRLHGVFGRIPADPPIPEQVMNKQILKAPKSGTPYAEYWPDAADAAWITSMHPGLGLLIADQWDVIASDMEILHATEQPHGIVDHAGQAHAAWASPLDAARLFLGEEADADA